MELTLDQALQKGIEAHKAGKVEEADRYYTAILKAQPKYPDANHNMGVLAVGVGKVQEALPFFKTALETNSSVAQYWLSYIDALIKLDKITDAKAVFDQAKNKGAKGNGFDQLEIRLAQFTQTDDNQSNKKILDKAIELRERGKYDEAIDFLTNKIDSFDTTPNLPAILSHCYMLNDNLKQAKVYLDAAKKINPDIPSVGWNETRLLLKQNKVNEALALAYKTNKLFPDDIEGMAVLGSCLRASSRFDESLKYLNKAIELSPDYAEALINRGLVSLAKKDKARALEDLEKAHHLKPHIKQIWYLVLNLKMEIKEFESAIILAEEMIKISPLDDKILASVALCHQHLQNYEKAVAYYNKALTINPNYGDSWANLGSALKMQGRSGKAIAAYRKALVINPDNAAVHNNMGVALQDLNKLDEAIEAFDKALQLKPDYPEAYNNTTELLKGYSPKRKRSHNLFTLDSQIKELSPKLINAHSNQEIINYLFKGLSCISEDSFEYKTPLSQIYKRNNTDLNCRRHKKIFDTKNIIPEFCFGCFKVQVEVATFIDLIKVTSLFYKFDLEEVSRKTIIELRPNISGNYKGLIYCKGLDQAKTVKDLLDIDLKETFGGTTVSKIKRGCSEYPLKFPEYGEIAKKPKKMMSFPNEWKIIEHQFDQNELKAPIETTQASIPKFCLSDFFIIQKWIDYAKGIGDKSIEVFNDRPIIYKDIYELAKLRSEQQ